MKSLLAAVFLALLTYVNIPTPPAVAQERPRVALATAEQVALRTQVARFGASISHWCEQHNEHHVIGSAVLIGWHKGRALFATAAHVVMDAASGLPTGTGVFQLKPSLGGIGVDARVGTAELRDDVAILYALGPAPGWVAGAAAELAFAGANFDFADCVAYGHPDGVGLGHLSRGYVSGNVLGRRWQVSAPIFFGNSGGGVYAKNEFGRWVLLGVAQQIRGTDDGNHVAPHVALASATETIHLLAKVVRDITLGEMKAAK